MRLVIGRRLAAPLFTALIGLHTVTGCAASNTPLASPDGPVNVRPVSDDEFGAKVHEVLVDGSLEADRLGLLAGVVRRQLSRASRHFELGHPQQGEDAVAGAFLLMRPGEARKEMIESSAGPALAHAIELASARGDEGHAKGLMLVRQGMLAPGTAERVALDEHMAALARWEKETRLNKVEIDRVALDEKAATSRALLDPTQDTVSDAIRSLDRLILLGIEINMRFQLTNKRPTRVEAVETTRALQAGAPTMMALFLRFGDAKGALSAIERTSSRQAIEFELYARLRAAADEDTAEAFRDLADGFSFWTRKIGTGETGMPESTARAARFGITLEAYRREPTHFPTTRELSRLLIGLGLQEAVPHLLAPALGKEPRPEDVSAAIALVAGALRESADVEDASAARRTMRAAAPIVALAASPAFRSKTNPGVSDLRYLMASIELRAGNLAGARPVLEAAVRDDPSAASYTMLAMLERQAQKPEAALLHLSRATSPKISAGDILAVADAKLLTFEIHRDAGAVDRASAALDSALGTVLTARERLSPPAARARAERLLGRILDSYGEREGASRALDRALDLASDDPAFLGTLVMDAIGRALVRRDLDTARAALHKGIEARIPESDLLYGGLWLMLLERELRATPDGSAAQALESLRNRSGWTGKLAAWATGKLTDAELAKQAQTDNQRVEAAFYVAMASRVAGDPAALTKLQAVAKSSAIDLLEVQLARDLVAPAVRPRMPENVQLP